MTKKTNQIKREHFNPELRNLSKDLLQHLAVQLADDFQEHLVSRGQKLTEKDYHRLVMFMRDNGAATLTLSVEVTDKLLNDDWNIAPVSKHQTTLEDSLSSLDEENRKLDNEIYSVEQKRRAAAVEAGVVEE